MSKAGEPIEINKIVFHNTSTIYLICDQANSNTYINSKSAKTCIKSSTFNTEVILIEPSQPTPFYARVGQLNFHIQDIQSNNLPVKGLFCRLRINELFLQNRKNLPQIFATAQLNDGANNLQKIDKLDKFLRTEVESRDKLTKRFKRPATATTFSDLSVITAITTLGVASIILACTGIDIALIPVLASTGLFLRLGIGVIHKTKKIFDSIAKKHDKIKTLADSKLDTISGILSKSMEDSHISHQEYQLIIKEVEHYCKIKEEIRNKSKKSTRFL